MSNLLLRIHNFDQLRSAARKIDDGLHLLEEKFENVSNLGLSLDPRKTKKIGETVLDEIIDEIEEMKRDVTSVLRSHEDALEDRINDNQQISAFIEQLNNELHEMETQLAAKGNFIPYEPEPSIPPRIPVTDTESMDPKENTCSSTQSSFLEPRSALRRNETPEFRKLHSTMLSVNINSVMNTLNTSLDLILSPMSTHKEISKSTRNTSKKDKVASYEVDNRSILSEYCETTSNSLALLERKLNRTDDVMKTPIDPGVSVITMQLLGKSNLRTKVYKENLANISYSAK